MSPCSRNVTRGLLTRTCGEIPRNRTTRFPLVNMVPATEIAPHQEISNVSNSSEVSNDAQTHMVGLFGSCTPDGR